MNTYSMVCNCGDPFSVQADSLDAAKTMMKSQMTEGAIAEHMAAKHQPSDPVPTVDQVHAQIDSDLKQVEK